LGIGDWAQSPIPNPQSPFINNIIILSLIVVNIIIYINLIIIVNTLSKLYFIFIFIKKQYVIT